LVCRSSNKSQRLSLKNPASDCNSVGPNRALISHYAQLDWAKSRRLESRMICGELFTSCLRRLFFLVARLWPSTLRFPQKQFPLSVLRRELLGRWATTFFLKPPIAVLTARRQPIKVGMPSVTCLILDMDTDMAAAAITVLDMDADVDTADLVMGKGTE